MEGKNKRFGKEKKIKKEKGLKEKKNKWKKEKVGKRRKKEIKKCKINKMKARTAPLLTQTLYRESLKKILFLTICSQSRFISKSHFLVNYFLYQQKSFLSTRKVSIKLNQFLKKTIAAKKDLHFLKININVIVMFCYLLLF